MVLLNVWLALSISSLTGENLKNIFIETTVVRRKCPTIRKKLEPNFFLFRTVEAMELLLIGIFSIFVVCLSWSLKKSLKCRYPWKYRMIHQKIPKTTVKPENTESQDPLTTTTAIFIHTVKVQKKKKGRERENKKETIENEMIGRYITICTIFESVCNSQSSEAFELAAVYLQVKKERRKQVIIKTKLIHKARSVMKTEWRYYINRYDYKVNFSWIFKSMTDI